MFEDLIPEKHQDNNGCWNCKHASPQWASLYCNYFKKYKTSFNGTGCKEWKEN